QTPGEVATALSEIAARLEAGRPVRPKLDPTDKTIVGGGPGSLPVPSTQRRAAIAVRGDLSRRRETDTEQLPPRRAPSTQLMRRLHDIKGISGGTSRSRSTGRAQIGRAHV